MKELILYRKYEPKTLEDYIILPRVYDIIKDGVLSNLIFHGIKGMGKTTLANILTKGYPTLFIDASLNTNIDTLRVDISEFCSKSSINFGVRENKFKYNEGLKFVILDEFERLTPMTMDALKGFIQNNDSNVRFIATTNHLHKVTNQELLSRFNIINFNPMNDDEKKHLGKEYFKRMSMIAEKESINIDTEGIKDIIKKSFPDLRKMILSLIIVKQEGSYNLDNHRVSGSVSNELYNFILSNKNGLDTYTFVDKNYGDTKIHELFTSLGKPFMEYLCKSNPNYANVLDDIIIETAKYMHIHNTCTDPMLVGVALLAEIKKILNNIK